MNREQLYHKSVDILVQAYFNNTLIIGNCFACAIGNLVAANMNYQYEAVSAYFPSHRLGWKGIPNYINGENMMKNTWFYSVVKGAEGNPVGKQQIKSTGYNEDEVRRIENAFENNHTGNDSMFNSLMAVVKVLDEIHENVEEEVSKASQQKFVKCN